MKKKVVTLEICTDMTNDQLEEYIGDVVPCDPDEVGPETVDITQSMVMEIQEAQAAGES